MYLSFLDTVKIYNYILYLIPLMVLLIIILIFFLRIKTAVYCLFIVGFSTQYLWRIKLGPITGLDLLGIGLPFLLIGGFIREKKIGYEFRKDPLIMNHFFIICILMFFGVVMPCLLYPSHSFTNSFEKLSSWYKLFNGFIVFLVVSSLFSNKKDINTLLNCMLLSLVIPCSIFAWQTLTGNINHNLRTGYSVANALVHHPGVIAYTMVFHFPICLLKFNQSQTLRDKSFWAMVGLIFIILIYFTYRRGVWIGLFVQLSTYLLIFQKGKKRVIYGYFICLIAIAAALTPFYSIVGDRFSGIMTFYSNIHEIFDTNRYDDLFSGRWGFFKANLLYLVKQPFIHLIVGNGIGATNYASVQMGAFGGGHNIYLILLVDFGLFCFLSYFTFITLLFVKLRRSLDPSEKFENMYSISLIVLLFSYLVMGISTHILYGNIRTWVFWGLMGAFVGLTTKKQGIVTIK